MQKVRIIEFEPQYKEESKRLARVAMADVGIEPKIIELYIEDDFDYETIPEVYKDRSRLWLALAENRVVGTVAMSEVDEAIVRLRRMFVLPEFQGQGVGQQLFDTAFAFAKGQGYEKIILDTDRIMYKARRFYEKNGFHKARNAGDRVFYERII